MNIRELTLSEIDELRSQMKPVEPFATPADVKAALLELRRRFPEAADRNGRVDGVWSFGRRDEIAESACVVLGGREKELRAFLDARASAKLPIHFMVLRVEERVVLIRFVVES